MKNNYINLVITATLILVMAMFAYRVSLPKPAADIVTKPGKMFGPYTVTYVIDGDTVVLNTGDRVRMKGIDAPELHHPVIPAQRFGEEAKEYLAKQIQGKQVMLEFDSGDSKDMYERALAYIFLNGIDVNGDMVRMGYAYAYVFKPHKREQEYKIYEKEARDKKRGLWNFTMKDGRIANIVNKYGRMTDDGKQKFEEYTDKLVEKYTAVTEER
jgi:micrococcal nuclease